MADPRRYYIDPDGDKLAVVASPSGDWIKWHDFSDYKAAQRRNASAEMNERLGIEIAEMRSRIADLEADKEAETKATFDAIRLITQLRDENAALAAENERLRKAGDAMAHEFKFIGGATVEAWHAAKEGSDAK